MISTNNAIPVPKINWKALKHKKVEYLRELLSTYGTDILFSADNSGLFPIHWAVICGNDDIIELMISSGVSPRMKAEIYDSPEPIHFAAIEGRIHTIDLLLSHGIDINTKDNSGCTPVMRASMFGSNMKTKSSETVLHMISKGSDITERDGNDMNCLHYAILHNNEETVHLLLNLGLDPNERIGRGFRAIDFAMQSGNEYLMKVLAPLTEGITDKDLELIVVKYKKKRFRETLTEILCLLARIIVLFAVFSALFWTYPQYFMYYLPKSQSHFALHFLLILTNIMAWISWYKTCITNPGYLPLNSHKYRKILKTKVQLGLKAQTLHKRDVDPYVDIRLCHTCKTVQTMRSTHCRFCNRCTAGFDHHCLYLSTCIGINNRIAFFCLSVSLLMVGQLGALLVWTVAQSEDTIFTPYHWFNFLYCIKFSIIGLMITLCNIRRAAINLTQNEEIKCFRYQHLNDGNGKFVNPFDRGSYWKNICDYFTNNSYKYSKLNVFDLNV